MRVIVLILLACAAWADSITVRQTEGTAHGFVVLRETASRPDGATLDLEEVHVLAIDDDGCITDQWDLPSDPEAHDRFFDGEQAVGSRRWRG